jgi:hypothetical protein
MPDVQFTSGEFGWVVVRPDGGDRDEHLRGAGLTVLVALIDLRGHVLPR